MSDHPLKKAIFFSQQLLGHLRSLTFEQINLSNLLQSLNDDQFRTPEKKKHQTKYTQFTAESSSKKNVYTHSTEQGEEDISMQMQQSIQKCMQISNETFLIAEEQMKCIERHVKELAVPLEPDQYVLEVKEQMRQITQSNTKLMLQNRLIKADNKIILSHLDRIISQHAHIVNKSESQIILEKDRKNIDSLKKKTLQDTQKGTSYKQIYPSERDGLSNKIKFDNLATQYFEYQTKTIKRIEELQQKISEKDKIIQGQNSMIHKLQLQNKSLSEIKDLQKQSEVKRQRLIQQQQLQIEQLTKHNENISIELQKMYKKENFKQKIGHIVHSTTVYNFKHDRL